MSAFVQAEGIKIGQIIHAVRVAVTGKGVGFGLFESLASDHQNLSFDRATRAEMILYTLFLRV